MSIINRVLRVRRRIFGSETGEEHTNEDWGDIDTRNEGTTSETNASQDLSGFTSNEVVLGDNSKELNKLLSTCSSNPIRQVQYSVCATMVGEDLNNYDTVTQFVIDSGCTEHMVQKEVLLHQLIQYLKLSAASQIWK